VVGILIESALLMVCQGGSGSASGSVRSAGSTAASTGSASGAGPPPRDLHWDWYDQPDCAVMVLYCPDRGPAVRVTLGDIPEGAAVEAPAEERANRRLDVELRSLDRIYRLRLHLEAPVNPAIKPQHSADSTKVTYCTLSRTWAKALYQSVMSYRVAQQPFGFQRKME